VRTLIALLGAVLLLTQAAYPQGRTKAPPIEMTPAQKAQMQDQEAARKATDEQYNAALKHTRDSDQKLDPWSNMRAPAGTAK